MQKTAPPKTYRVKSFGCQMNVYDGDRMGELLSEQGLSSVGDGEDADLVVLNTCQHPLDSSADYRENEVKLEIFDGGVAERNDPSLKVREENLRAWENNHDYHTLRF